jgi:hypothetical protein
MTYNMDPHLEGIKAMASITLSNSVSLIENTNQNFNLYNVLSQAGLTAPPPIGTLVIQVKNSSGVYVTAPTGTYVGLDLDAGAGKETLEIAMTSLPNFTGHQDLKLIITDGVKDTITLFLGVDVLPTPPTAQADSSTIIEDTIATGNVLSNDSDTNGHPLSVTQFQVNGATYTAGATANIAGVGSLSISTDGSYSFTPASHYYGPVPQATYTVSDGFATATSTLNVTVTPLPPAASPDSQTLSENSVASGNVLGNDSDVNGLPLTVTGFTVAGQTHLAGESASIAGVGTLTIAADGSYSFTPATNYYGPVPQASYTITDGNGTAHSTLDLAVTPLPPAASPDAQTIAENSVASGNVLGNDSDVNGLPLTVTGFTVAGQTHLAGESASIAGVGTLSIAADGSYSFTPATNYYGPVPQASYTITDGNGTAHSTLDLAVTPLPPAASPDAQTIAENTVASGNVLGNDSDINGLPLTVTGFTVAGQTHLAGESASIAGVGTLSIAADGSYSFTPATNYYGPVPQATYTITDGNGTAHSTLDLAVTPLPPAASPDSQTLSENSVASGNVLGNDSDVNGLPLTVTGFTVVGQTHLAGESASIAGVGTLTIAADGSYSFTPATNYYGPVPQASYTITDGTAHSTLDLAVTPLPPAASPDAQTIAENSVASGNVLGNDSDVNGLPLTVTGFTVAGQTHLAGESASIAGVGTLTIAADGSYSFTPATNYYGPVPQASYTITDGNGSATSTLDLNVTPLPPAANADSQIVPQNTVASGNVLTNDTDINHLPLTVTGFDVAGGHYAAGATATLAGVGTLSIAADGSYTFTPLAT